MATKKPFGRHPAKSQPTWCVSFKLISLMGTCIEHPSPQSFKIEKSFRNRNMITCTKIKNVYDWVSRWILYWDKTCKLSTLCCAEKKSLGASAYPRNFPAWKGITLLTVSTTNKSHGKSRNSINISLQRFQCSERLKHHTFHTFSYNLLLSN